MKTKFCEVFTKLDEDPYFSFCFVEKLKKTLCMYHTSPASTNTQLLASLLLFHKMEVTDSPGAEMYRGCLNAVFFLFLQEFLLYNQISDFFADKLPKTRFAKFRRQLY